MKGQVGRFYILTAFSVFSWSFYAAKLSLASLGCSFINTTHVLMANMKMRPAATWFGFT